MAPASWSCLAPRNKSILLVLTLAVTTFLYYYHQHLVVFPPQSTTIEDEIRLPEDLEDLVLRRFDELVESEELLYEPSESEIISEKGFPFELRVVPILKEKPVAAPDDPGTDNSEGVFMNLPASEIITTVGPSHRLIFDKYCVYRPTLLLTTVDFVRQTHDLDESDISAAWAVLKAFEAPKVLVYNNGIHAGSTQDHKHMQLFPMPDPTSIELFPSKAGSYESITSDIGGVPFKHFVLLIPKLATAKEVLRKYERLLVETENALEEAEQEHNYNVILTAEWIAMIPRSKVQWGSSLRVNALGMIGLVSVRDEDEKELWAELGWAAHLRELGIAIDS